VWFNAHKQLIFSSHLPCKKQENHFKDKFMKDKFTYFDFLAYFIPGTMLLWVCMVVAGNLEVLSVLETGNAFAESLAFIVLAFVVGHLIQFRSKQRTEKTIKRKYWSNSFVSSQFLIKGNQFCVEPNRQRYIQLLQKHLGLKSEEAQILKDFGNDTAKEISHSMYRICFTLTTDKGIGAKATKANEYYNFFRGLSTTCVYSSIIFTADLIYVLIRFLINDSSFPVSHAIVTLLLAVFFGYASYAFRIRAKQRGELHVAEVFDSMAAHFAEK